MSKNILEPILSLDPVYQGLIGLDFLIFLWFGIWSWPFFLLIVLPVSLKIYAVHSCGKTKSQRRIDGKVAIVTGANTGLGYETTKEFVRRGGKVIMACRSVEKAKTAADQIKKEIPDADLTIMKLDTSSLKSVREFAKKFLSEQTRLDILVNNAGASMEMIKTEDNLEVNMAANHFGPFLLTNLLLDLMRKTGKSRIIMVSSVLHNFVRGLDLENLNSEKDSTKSKFLYPRTKLANILFTRELDRRLRAAKINEVTINALHPGSVKTDITRNMGEEWFARIISKIREMFTKTPWEGAQTQIHLAVADEVEELSGLYWVDCKESCPSTTAQNVQLAKDLWEKSAQFVGLKPDETIV
jgi:NAD(P)-dependent dehydrogenase (short-subunit alcohol dehydrogenase family)